MMLALKKLGGQCLGPDVASDDVCGWLCCQNLHLLQT